MKTYHDDFLERDLTKEEADLIANDKRLETPADMTCLKNTVEKTGRVSLKCRQCGKTKLVTYFYQCRGYKVGLRGACIECQRENYRRRREKDKQKAPPVRHQPLREYTQEDVREWP